MMEECLRGTGPRRLPTGRRRAGAIALACALASLFTAGPTARAEEAAPPTVRATVRDLDVEGLTQRLLYVAPAAPRAVLVMLPGGAGDIGIAGDGSLRHGDNFLVRTRARFAALGFAVLIPDAAGTRSLRGRRSTPAYGGIVAALVRAAGQMSGRPVFLLGTSQGAIAAVNGAAHMAKGTIAGLVLTESVSRRGGSGETVFDADPAAVTAPVLIIANDDDACPVAPPADAARIARSLKSAADVQVVHASGGLKVGQDCGSRSPHGYWGMDEQVVGLIADWIDWQLVARRR